MNSFSCMQRCCFYESSDSHYYRPYKMCSWCGFGYDDCPCYTCPYYGDYSDDPPAGGFVFFPELEVETSLSRLFPELFFYP